MNVFIIAALSADGYIGLDENHLATTWTTKSDKRFFTRKTKEAGVVVMGRKTFETFNKPLKERRLIVVTRQPELVTVEGVEATSEQPAELLARLEREGATQVAIAGGASIYSLFMKSGLVNEFYTTIMPKMFGQGVTLFNNVVDKDLQLVEVKPLKDGNTVMLHYNIL